MQRQELIEIWAIMVRSNLIVDAQNNLAVGLVLANSWALASIPAVDVRAVTEGPQAIWYANWNRKWTGQVDAHVGLGDIAHNRSEHHWVMVLHPPCSAGQPGRPVPVFVRYTQSGALYVV